MRSPRLASPPGYEARILNATLSGRRERLFALFAFIVEAHLYQAPNKSGRAGVDLGLQVIATIADDSGTITQVPDPAPLCATLSERRRNRRQLSRRIPGSPGGESQARPAGPRVVHLRWESHHQLSSWPADTYSEVVVEDLDLAAMRLGFYQGKRSGAGDGNRTRIASLEGWSSTIELRPRVRRDYPAGADPWKRLPGGTCRSGRSAGPGRLLVSGIVDSEVLRRSKVTVHGSADVRPVVFAHGHGCEENLWRFVAPALEGRYDLVAFEDVGAGASECGR